jgi:hypothetical protein
MCSAHLIVHVLTPAAGVTAAYISSSSAAATVAGITEELLCLTCKLLPHILNFCCNICTPAHCNSASHRHEVAALSIRQHCT